MNRIHVNPQSPDPGIIRQAADVLQAGGVVIHPTETVYGLAAVWNRESALRRVQNIKGRSWDKPFSIMVAQTEDILKLSGWEMPSLQQFLEALFPAPVTLIFKRKKKLTVSYWNQFPTIGFRIPDHPLSVQLVQKTGAPLITTSANIANRPAPASAEEVDSRIAEQADLFLDGGKCPLQIPSTVIRMDVEEQAFTVIRPGAYPADRFQQLFRKYFS